MNDSHYTGPMVGKGFAPFAIMAYALDHQSPDGLVFLHPQILSVVLGEPVEAIQNAIAILCNCESCSSHPKAWRYLERLDDLDEFTFRIFAFPNRWT